jgi:hypothetical protein
MSVQALGVSLPGAPHSRVLQEGAPRATDVR